MGTRGADMTSEEYARARAALIPLAELYADQHVPIEKYKNKREYSMAWDKVFIKHMDHLAYMAGLICKQWR